MNIEQIFFELIQVAIGTRICLSHTPNADEWSELYAMAKKQSLVGVCFAGVQKLQTQRQEPPEMLYLKWMGMAAKIQQRNEVVNRQCVELQAKLSADGIRSSILKGQGVGQYYGQLAALRQSGDIDVYVDCGREKAIEYARGLQGEVDWDYKHLHLHVFQDTEVEVHFMPTCLKCPQSDKVLQTFFDTEKEECFKNGVASQRLNEVFILAHAYRHLTNEGVGLRQLKDYFFVLLNRQSADTKLTHEEFVSLMKKTGMMRFAQGVMWMMQSVFGLPEEYLLCDPSEKDGRFLLDEVMLAGNFGHHDKRTKHDANESALHRFWRLNIYSFRVFSYAYKEVLWAPIWRAKHWCWRKRNGYK